MGTLKLDRQLDLLDARLWSRERRIEAARQLADALSELLGERIRLLVHDNRSTMVSFRRVDGILVYRIHHMFLDAPREVVAALAAFAGSSWGRSARRRQASEHIDAYVREHRARIGVPHPARLVAQGDFHDLQSIFDHLNAAWFDGRVDARIGWGPNRPGRRRGRRRTIKTGVYVQDARLIRIHPALDRPEVPERYVAAVVFHEMLHQVVPAVERNGRRVVHGREFRRRERAYPDHELARRWEQAHLELLLGG